MGHIHGVCQSSCHTCHHHALLHKHALRAGGVQCLDLKNDFGGILSTSHSVGRWSQDVRKTYALQQDGGDSDMRGGDEVVHSHDAHMACITQAVTHAITTQCCMHIHCVQVACSVWTCEVTSVASRPPLIACGFGHKGAKTYGLQQDGGDSDMRGGDEAVQSRGAHMA